MAALHALFLDEVDQDEHFEILQSSKRMSVGVSLVFARINSAESRLMACGKT